MSERTPRQLLEPKLLEPFSNCSSCIETLDDLDWVASSTFHVGPWALGVRSSSIEMDDAFRRVLGAHLVDIEAPANFSALMADESGTDGQVRAFNFLYRSTDPLVRSRAPVRVMRALLHYLSDFAEPASSMIRLAAAAQQVVNAEAFGAQQILDVMAGVVAQTPAVDLWWEEPAELASQLCGLANGSSS